MPATVPGVAEVAGSAAKRGSLLPELTCQYGSQMMEKKKNCERCKKKKRRTGA